MRKRLMAVMAAIAVVLTGLGVRLYSLSSGELRQASQQQSTRRDVIAVSRGTIYDRYAQPLVNRTKRIVASVAPFAECMALAERTLSGQTRTAALEALSKGERATVEPGEWLPPTIGVTQITAPQRYEEDALACHLVGYVNSENEGVCGVEKAYESLLSSYDGEASVSYPIDALGRICIDGEDVLSNTLSNAVGGVALTLDREIQHLAQRLATEYLERGAVVVTDAMSGEILASVSVPVYDQNRVEASLSDPASPLLDRTRSDYNLGSVFKILIAAAALENGFPVETAYTCGGVVTVDGVRFRCHNPLGEGRQTMREAMANSCNCYFIQLALDVGAMPIYSLAERAGFTRALTLLPDLQTSCAILPSKRDLSADAALANLSIGQGDLLSTPHHVAVLLQAVAANGVMVEPTLLYGTVDSSGQLTEDPTPRQSVRLFSESTAKALGDMLKAVVANGTGTAAKPNEYSAAGKTGTAETGWEQNGEEVVQSWFAGYYPADDPQFVIVVLSENGGANGKSAAPLFAAVANALFSAGLVETREVLS